LYKFIVPGYFCSLLSLPQLNVGIDAGSLKALRAARVLRPLKLVSGIPSKYCMLQNDQLFATPAHAVVSGLIIL